MVSAVNWMALNLILYTQAVDAFEKRYPQYVDVKNLKADDIARAVLYAVTQPPGVAVNEILVQPTDLYLQ